MDEFLLEFIEESKSHIEIIEDKLSNISLEDTDIDELINDVFRSAHSVKGGASFFNFNNIVTLAHKMENIFDKIRLKEVTMNNDIINILIESNDKLSDIIYDIDNEESSDIVEISNKLDNLLNIEPSNNVKIEKKENKSLEDDPIFLEMLQAAFKEQKSKGLNIDNGSNLEKEVDKLLENKETKVRNKQVQKETIRIDVNIIDELMDLTGEMILKKNYLKSNKSSEKLDLNNFVTDLENLVIKIQDQVLKARVNNIGVVFNKFPRIVRDIVKNLNKKIKLDINGSEIEVDKSIIETLQDPLTHLIRNSCDHAIEEIDDRLKKGKNEEGLIKLSAKQIAGNIIIDIEDDGKGIDPNAILEKAIQKGLVSESDSKFYSEKEKLNLIFLPGFSTKDEATSMSGRGVGMDVVKTNIEKSQGFIEIKSKIDEGTRFRLRLPLTIAIMPGLKFMIGDYQFIIPENDVDELVLLSQDQRFYIKYEDGIEYLVMRNELLPIINIPNLLNINTKNEYKHFIVVSIGKSKYAVKITKILEREEILVKPLPKILYNNYYSGLTILGTGEIVPIISTDNVIKFSNVSDIKNNIIKDKNKIVNVDKDYLIYNINNKKILFPIKLIHKIKRYDNNVIKDGKNYTYKGKEYIVKELTHITDLNTKYLILVDYKNKNLALKVDNIEGSIRLITDEILDNGFLDELKVIKYKNSEFIMINNEFIDAQLEGVKV